jgi:chromosome segregation ATPase
MHAYANELAGGCRAPALTVLVQHGPYARGKTSGRGTLILPLVLFQVSAVVEHQHNLATQLQLRTAGEAEATRQLQASSACYSSAVAKLDAAVAGRREAEAALKDARSRLHRQAKQLQAAQQAVQEGERRVVEAELRHSSQQLALGELQRECAALHEQHRSVCQRMDESSREVSQQRQQAKEQASAARARLRAVEADRARMQASCTETEEQLADARRRLAAAHSDGRAAEEASSHMAARLQTAQADVVALREHNAQLLDTQRQLQASIDALEAERRGQADAARAACGSQATALTALEVANRELRADNVELVRSVQRLHDQWCSNDPAAMAAQAAEARAQAQRAEQRATALQRTVEEQAAALADAQHATGALQGTLERLHAQSESSGEHSTHSRIILELRNVRAPFPPPARLVLLGGGHSCVAELMMHSVRHEWCTCI